MANRSEIIMDLHARLAGLSGPLENHVNELLTWGKMRGVGPEFVISVCRGWMGGESQKGIERLETVDKIGIELVTPAVPEILDGISGSSKENRIEINHTTEMGKIKSYGRLVEIKKYAKLLTGTILTTVLGIFIFQACELFGYDEDLNRYVRQIDRQHLKNMAGKGLLHEDIVHLIIVDRSGSIDPIKSSRAWVDIEDNIQNRFLDRLVINSELPTRDPITTLALGLCNEIYESRKEYSSVRLGTIAFGINALPNVNQRTYEPHLIEDDLRGVEQNVDFLLTLWQESRDDKSNFLAMVDRINTVIQSPDYNDSYFIIHLFSDMLMEVKPTDQAYQNIKSKLRDLSRHSNRLKFNIYQLPAKTEQLEKHTHLGFLSNKSLIDQISSWQKPFRSVVNFKELTAELGQMRRNNVNDVGYCRVLLKSLIHPNLDLNLKPLSKGGFFPISNIRFFKANENEFVCLNNDLEEEPGNLLLYTSQNDLTEMTFKIDNYMNMEPNQMTHRLLTLPTSAGYIQNTLQSICLNVGTSTNTGDIGLDLVLYDEALRCNFAIPIYIKR